MMHKLRENTKIILWVVVVAFVVTIFAVWGLDLRTGNTTVDPGIVGKVNGIPISRQQYQFVYEQFAKQFRANSQNQPLTFSQEEFINSQTWDNLVYGILTDQQIEQMGITVTDEEIVAFLRDSPPAEVRQYFLDDQGNFDNQAYQAALNNPEINWTNLEDLARERIPRTKLNHYLSAQVHVSEEEIRHSYESESIELRISYVEFPFESADLEEYVPDDSEIESYYEAHQENYKEPEMAKVDIVKVELKPSDTDIADAEFTAGRVHDQLTAGENFADLAKTYSEAPTSVVDGNTGFIAKGRRDDAYFTALDSLTDDELSAPIMTDEGFYVLKLIEKREAESGEMEYNVQEILVKPSLSRQTVDSLYNVATAVLERAREVDLEAAASEHGLDVLSPGAFAEGTPIGGIGFVPALSRFAFANEQGSLSNILRDENNIYVGRVAERIPETITPLSEVKDVVSEQLINDKKKSVTERDAKAFYHKARNEGFAPAAALYGVEIKTPEKFRATDNLDHFGTRSPVAAMALTIEAAQVAPPVETRASYVVLELHERSDIDAEDYQQKAPELRERILNQKIQQYVSYWYEKLKESSDIEDLRGQS